MNNIELNYDIMSCEWRQLEKTSQLSNFPLSLIKGFLRLLWFILKSILSFRISFFKKGRVELLVGTPNNYQAAFVLDKKGLNTRVVGFHNYTGRTTDTNVPSILFYIVGLFLFHRVIVSYYSANGYQRKCILNRLDQFVASSGAIFVWKNLFKLTSPKFVFTFNDHNFWMRSAVAACNELGIPSGYVPHAPVGKGFPPLSTTYSFLDGEMQARLYEVESSEIIYSGALRYEEIVLQNKERRSKSLYICFNMLDSKKLILEVLDDVKSGFTGGVYIKAHPRDKDRFNFFKNACDEYGFTFLDASFPLYKLLDKGGYVLAGVSGVHIDALMCGLVPVTLKQWYKGDYYCLIENNSLLVLSDISDLAAREQNFVKGLQASANLFNQHLDNIQRKPSDVILSIVQSKIC
ncbi:hypothetical protein [Kangiella sp. TOML190]|uniref:hypothetical protein n=1 Tax=Kangiella sp. TOML190 TaxID=2931351 RepID=UPI00203FF78A|nr:hypothetical protein [Kangiella sp. TOML190]